MMLELLSPFFGWIIPAVLAVLALFVAFMKGKSGAEERAKAEAAKVEAQHQKAEAAADKHAAQVQFDAVIDRTRTEKEISAMPEGKAQEALREKWSRD